MQRGVRDSKESRKCREEAPEKVYRMRKPESRHGGDAGRGVARAVPFENMEDDLNVSVADMDVGGAQSANRGRARHQQKPRNPQGLKKGSTLQIAIIFIFIQYHKLLFILAIISQLLEICRLFAARYTWKTSRPYRFRVFGSVDCLIVVSIYER